VQFLLAAESTKFISVISFGKELYKRRERSESRSFRFKRQLPSSVSLSQRSLANRKVFRIGLHATASKSSPRKALFSSVQEQSQHQPKDNFLEEHNINVSNLFEINETQVKVTIVYPSRNVAIPTLPSRQAIPVGITAKTSLRSSKTINSLFLFHF
jgi:hypothetical protein